MKNIVGHHFWPLLCFSMCVFVRDMSLRNSLGVEFGLSDSH